MVGPAGQPIAVYSGNEVGQTIGSGSNASVSVYGVNVTVEVSLAATNQPDSGFQVYYSVDGGAPVLSGLSFTTDSQGNGGGSSTIEVANGTHTLGLDINNTPGAGITYYNLPQYVTFTVDATL